MTRKHAFFAGLPLLLAAAPAFAGGYIVYGSGGHAGTAYGYGGAPVVIYQSPAPAYPVYPAYPAYPVYGSHGIRGGYYGYPGYGYGGTGPAGGGYYDVPAGIGGDPGEPGEWGGFRKDTHRSLSGYGRGYRDGYRDGRRDHHHGGR